MKTQIKKQPQDIALILDQEIMDEEASYKVTDYIVDLKRRYIDLLIRTYRASDDYKILVHLFREHNLVLMKKDKWAHVFGHEPAKPYYVSNGIVLEQFHKHQHAFKWLMELYRYDKQ